MIDLAFPPLEITGHEKYNILRWEDDGGSVFELETPYLQTGGKDATTIKPVWVVRTHERIRIGEN